MEIFGHSWDSIMVKQGGSVRAVDLGPEPTATKGDKDLLAKHGLDGLKKMGFFGVINRLQASNLI